MEKERRVKALAIVVLVIAVLGLTIAFAALSQTLTINGKGTLDAAKWDIKFKNLNLLETNGDATIISEAKINSSDTTKVENIKVNLKTPGDSAYYTVDLANEGDINAEIESINKTDLSDNKLLTFKVYYTESKVEVSIGDKLNSKETKNITIAIIYNKDINEEDLYSEDTTIDLSYEIVYRQAEDLISDSGEKRERSVSEIASAVFGENGLTTTATMCFDYNTDGQDTTRTFSLMRVYNTYLLPVKELNLKTGDKIILKNDNNDYSYTFARIASDLSGIAGSIAVNPETQKEYVITSNDKYLSLQVVKYGVLGDSSTLQYFEKDEIPLEDFKIYKTSISNENEINYISIWDKMLDYDNKFNKIDFGLHNADADQRNDLSIQLPYFQVLDIDLRNTKDGQWVNCHNEIINGLLVANQTVADLQAINPNIILWSDICEYAAANNIKLRISDNTARINDSLVQTSRYTKSNLEEILSIAEQYNAKSLVSIGGNYWENFENILDLDIGFELWNQTASMYNIEEYKNQRQQVTALQLGTSMSSTGFTQTQIKELLKNDINILIGGGQSSLKVMQQFCDSHKDILDDVVGVSLEHKDEIHLFVAAYRNAKGLD